MKTAYILSGRITPEGNLELDERAPLPAGPVRVAIEAVEADGALNATSSPLMISEAEWKRRKAIMDSCIGCLSDEEARRIIETVEEEFERIDPDDWR